LLDDEKRCSHSGNIYNIMCYDHRQSKAIPLLDTVVHWHRGIVAPWLELRNPD